MRCLEIDERRQEMLGDRREKTGDRQERCQEMLGDRREMLGDVRR